MLYQGNRTTKARSKYARFLDDANTDMVMSFTPIPPGSVIQRITYNYTTVGRESIPLEQAMETTLHGFIWTSPYPYHGYGTNLAGADSLWDDVIPKDQSIEAELEDMQQDVIAAFSAQSTSGDQGAIESGAHSEDNDTQFLANILDRGPKCIYARQTRHDVSNSIVADTNKMRPFDHQTGKIENNFYVPRDKYAYIMFGVGAPKFEVVDDSGLQYQPTDDLQWNQIAYPELEHILTMAGNLDEQAPNNSGLSQNRFQRHLEAAEIEANTYEDNSGTAMTHWVSFLDTTVKYLRPRFPDIAADSRLTRD